MKRIWLKVWRCGIVLMVLGTCGSAGAAEYAWWEGETPKETNFPARSDFAPSTFTATRQLLSGGDWLSSSGKAGREPLYAKYRVEAPADGEYALWARKFWKHGPFRWRFDEGAWQVCGRDVALADDTYLRQFVGANWVFLAKVQPKQGPRTFEIQLLASEGEDAAAAFDCFVLATGPFMPNGKWKPGEKSGRADEGYFAYEPGIDPFSPEAMVDLRSLNEPVAGESGFLKRDGDRIALGNGQGVRFWGVNVTPNNMGQDRPSIDYLARRLAKLGVNMVRCHGPIFDAGADPARVDAKALDHLFYTVAAMKRHGIYSTISFYFPLWLDVKESYGIAGYDSIKNKKPFALLYFDPRMQEVYRAWARQLLTTKNPYTGLTLGSDPAVGIVEIVNEDSLFFWTFTKQNVPEVQWRKLEELYGRWLARRYGSVAQAIGAWGDARLPEDEAAKGIAGLYEAWHMTAAGLKQGGASKVKRIGDQVQFLAEQQREFYASTVQYFKHDLGVGGLVSTSNWTVSDPRLLMALERYTYTAGDVMDRHGYFGGEHKGDGADYSVRVGHTFTDLAAVNVPERLPIQAVQVEGYPQIISELGWTNPNRYRADATFLTSAYASLQGVDGVFFFAAGSNFVCDTTMNKFGVCSPVMAGTFPAAALLYRRGDVREADAVVREMLDLKDLYAMKGSGTASPDALDELRKKDLPQGAVIPGAVDRYDPLACYVGRVVQAFGVETGQSFQRDLSGFIDRRQKIIRSLTGELTWDYGTGIVRINTPRSQAAAGFLARAGKIDLADVVIESSNEFGSILVISLDGAPLPTSKRILIQAMTEERPYGFKADGGRITDLGSGPFGIRRIEARVSLKLRGADKPTVTALDECLCPTAKHVAIQQDGGNVPLVVQLSPDAMYHIIQR